MVRQTQPDSFRRTTTAPRGLVAGNDGTTTDAVSTNTSMAGQPDGARRRELTGTPSAAASPRGVRRLKGTTAPGASPSPEKFRKTVSYVSNGKKEAPPPPPRPPPLAGFSMLSSLYERTTSPRRNKSPFSAKFRRQQSMPGGATSKPMLRAISPDPGRPQSEQFREVASSESPSQSPPQGQQHANKRMTPRGLGEGGPASVRMRPLPSFDKWNPSSARLPSPFSRQQTAPTGSHSNASAALQRTISASSHLDTGRTPRRSGSRSASGGRRRMSQSYEFDDYGEMFTSPREDYDDMRHVELIGPVAKEMARSLDLRESYFREEVQKEEVPERATIAELYQCDTQAIVERWDLLELRLKEIQEALEEQEMDENRQRSLLIAGYSVSLRALALEVRQTDPRMIPLQLLMDTESVYREETDDSRALGLVEILQWKQMEKRTHFLQPQQHSAFQAIVSYAHRHQRNTVRITAEKTALFFNTCLHKIDLAHTVSTKLLRRQCDAEAESIYRDFRDRVAYSRFSSQTDGFISKMESKHRSASATLLEESLVDLRQLKKRLHRCFLHSMETDEAAERDATDCRGLDVYWLLLKTEVVMRSQVRSFQRYMAQADELSRNTLKRFSRKWDRQQRDMLLDREPIARHAVVLDEEKEWRELQSHKGEGVERVAAVAVGPLLQAIENEEQQYRQGTIIPLYHRGWDHLFLQHDAIVRMLNVEESSVKAVQKLTTEASSTFLTDIQEPCARELVELSEELSKARDALKEFSAAMQGPSLVEWNTARVPIGTALRRSPSAMAALRISTGTTTGGVSLTASSPLLRQASPRGESGSPRLCLWGGFDVELEGIRAFNRRQRLKQLAAGYPPDTGHPIVEEATRKVYGPRMIDVNIATPVRHADDFPRPQTGDTHTTAAAPETSQEKHEPAESSSNVKKPEEAQTNPLQQPEATEESEGSESEDTDDDASVQEEEEGEKKDSHDGRFTVFRLMVHHHVHHHHRYHKSQVIRQEDGQEVKKGETCDDLTIQDSEEVRWMCHVPLSSYVIHDDDAKAVDGEESNSFPPLAAVRGDKNLIHYDLLSPLPFALRKSVGLGTTREEAVLKAKEHASAIIALLRLEASAAGSAPPSGAQEEETS